MALALVTADESLLGRTSAGLRLRLGDQAQRNRVIEVEDTKCTIGTAEGCTIRLPEMQSTRRRLDPIECFILRGQAQTVVRSLAPGVRLNGQEFTDAVLHTGDRLAIGSYEIEVLPPLDEAQPPSITHAIRQPPAAVPEPAAQDAEMLKRVLMAERATWQAENDDLRAQLGRAEDQIERLSATAADHLRRQSELQASVAALQAELQESWTLLEEDRQRWQTERQHQHVELTQKTAALAAAVQQTSRLEASVAKANDRAAQHASDAKLAAARGDELKAELARLQDRLTQQGARFERERRAWQAEQELRLAELQQMSLTVGAAVEASTRRQDEIDRANEHAAQIAAEIKTRADQQVIAEQAIERLTAELADARRHLETSRTQRQAERESQSAELSRKSLELAAAVERLAQVEHDLSQANDRIARLNEDVTGQTSLYKRIQDALERSEDERKAAQAAFEQERAHFQAELEISNAKVEQKSAELADAAETVSRLNRQLADANDRLTTLTDELNCGAAVCQRTQEAIELAELARTEAETALEQERARWQAEREAGNAKFDEQSAQLADAAETISRLNDHLSQAEGRLATLIEELGSQTALYQRTQEQLELADLARAEAEAALAQERTRWQLESQAAGPAAASEELAPLNDELLQAQDQISRLHEALEQVAADHETARTDWERQQATQQAERDAQAAELNQKSTDLAAAIDQLSHLSHAFAEANEQVTRLTSEIDQQRELHRSAQDALEQLRQEFVRCQAVHAEEQANWQQLLISQQQETQRHLAEQMAAAAMDVADVSEPRMEPDDAAETDRAISQQPDIASPAAAPTGVLPAEKEVLATDDLLARYTAAEGEVGFEAPSSDSPVSTADLLSRFGLSPEHEASEAVPAEPVTDDQEVASEPTQRPATTVGEAHHDQDSIDAYMADLMARLGRSAYVPPRVEEPQTREPAVEEVKPATVMPAAKVPPTPKLRDPSEMGRRALPPELSADLSAMREIANINARAAIDNHARRNLLQAWLSKAAVMLLGLAAAGAETWFALEGNDTASYFIVPCMMVAIFWGWQYLAMAKRVSQARNDEADDDTRPDAASDAAVAGDTV